MLLAGLLGLCACNATMESAEPVGNTVWEDAATVESGCTRCGIVNQQKEIDEIVQGMLERDGEIRVPEVPSVPTVPPQK